MLSWMYWTLPVAIVFVGVFLMIVGMTLWGRFSPPHRRKGFLQIVTDRSERLYIAIVTFAFLMVLVFFFEIPALGLSALVAASVSAVILKWG